MIAATITFIAITAAFAAPLIAPIIRRILPRFLGGMENSPAWSDGGSSAYLLGTDNQGRDMLSTILYGGRISILVGIAAVFLGMLLGVTLGVISGYFGGLTDTIIMRIADVQLTIPGILVAILINGIVSCPAPGACEEFAIYVVIVAIGHGLASVHVLQEALHSWKQKRICQPPSSLDYQSLQSFCDIFYRYTCPVLVIATIGLALQSQRQLSFLGQGIPPTTPFWAIRVCSIPLLRNFVILFPAIALIILVFLCFWRLDVRCT